MFLVKSIFCAERMAQYDLTQLINLFNQLIDAWRYNGQIIGREIPLSYQQETDAPLTFIISANCPEADSLLAKNNNSYVQQALDNLAQTGFFLQELVITEQDLNSDETAPITATELVLYTTYVKSCSPLHDLTLQAPIPLYKLLKNTPHLSYDVIKWQENWQACDQLQMNGSILEQQALTEISELHSNLSKHGYALRQEIEQYTGIPTYYYLYRIGGESLQTEQQRCCPSCHKNWALKAPLFDLFDFKCDQCRLVSNLSWHWQ